MISLTLEDFTSAASIDAIKSKLEKFKNTDQHQLEIDRNLKYIRKDLDKKYAELQSDNDILCGVYTMLKDTKKEGLGAAEEIRETINEIRELKDEMENTLMEYALCGWGSGKSFEELFSELFDPLIEALDPLLDPISQLGIPEIPLINEIPNIIKKFTNMGRIISKLPPEIRNQAIEEAKAAKEKAKAAKEADYKSKREAAGANTTWTRMAYDYENSDSFVWKLVREIVEIFKAVVEMIEAIASCLEIFAILIIIDKFKPVIDMFKLQLGDAITILTGVKDLLKCIITGKYSLIKLLGKVLMSKVEGIMDFFTYVCNGIDLPSNAMISACYMDIISCQCDISSLQLSIDYFENESKAIYENKTIEKCDKEIKNTEKKIEKLKKKDPPSVEKIALQEGVKEFLEKYSAELLSSNNETLSAITKCDTDIKNFEANKGELFRSMVIAQTSQDEYLKVLNTPVANGK